MSASGPVQNDGDGKKRGVARQVANLSAGVRRSVFGAVCLAVFTIALLPGEPGEPSLIGWDKLSHIMAFIVLTVLLRAAWPAMTRRTGALGLLTYGLAIELGQSLTGWGRTASLADLVADLVGIGLGFVLLWSLAKLRAIQHAPPSSPSS